MNEVRREGKLLGTVVRMLKEVEAEIAGMIRDEPKRRHPAQRGQNHPIARRLAEIHGVGPQTAGILATEVFYRGFKNRREVASYVGLTPTPYNSGTMVRDQGISKAGNRRARAVAIERPGFGCATSQRASYRSGSAHALETRRGECGGLRSSLWRAN